MSTSMPSERPPGEQRALHFRWEDRPSETILGGITRRYIATPKQMIGEVRFLRGHEVPKHAHENEQFTCVLSGALEFFIGEAGESITVRAGEVIVIPSNVVHGLRALEDTIEFDLFTPPRADWIDPSHGLLRETR